MRSLLLIIISLATSVTYSAEHGIAGGFYTFRGATLIRQNVYVCNSHKWQFLETQFQVQSMDVKVDVSVWSNGKVYIGSPYGGEVMESIVDENGCNILSVDDYRNGYSHQIKIAVQGGSPTACTLGPNPILMTLSWRGPQVPEEKCSWGARFYENFGESRHGYKIQNGKFVWSPVPIEFEPK